LSPARTGLTLKHITIVEAKKRPTILKGVRIENLLDS
jgi:hypothetical protein